MPPPAVLLPRRPTGLQQFGSGWQTQTVQMTQRPLQCSRCAYWTLAPGSMQLIGLDLVMHAQSSTEAAGPTVSEQQVVADISEARSRPEMVDNNEVHSLVW